MLSLFNIDAPGAKSGLALLSIIGYVLRTCVAQSTYRTCENIYGNHCITHASNFYPCPHLTLQPDTVSVEIQGTGFTDKAEY